MYLVLNGTEHIRALAGRFDELIRVAVVQPPDVVKWLGGLLAEVEPRRRATRQTGARDGGS